MGVGIVSLSHQRLTNLYLHSVGVGNGRILLLDEFEQLAAVHGFGLFAFIRLTKACFQYAERLEQRVPSSWLACLVES